MLYSCALTSYSLISITVKIVDDGLDFYFHSLLFILFCFCFCFFLFLEQLGLGPIGHAVT